MFNSRQIQVLSQLTLSDQYIELQRYVEKTANNDLMPTVKELKKYLLSEFTLQSINENKNDLSALKKILEFAHQENKKIEEDRLTEYCLTPYLSKKVNTSYPSELSQGLTQQLVNEEKNNSTVSIIKTGFFTRSELSRIIVNLYAVMQTVRDDMAINVILGATQTLSSSTS